MQSLDGKTICKEYVQRGLGLPTKDVGASTHVKDKKPLVVCITRLVAQKGLHLIRHAIKRVEELVSLTTSLQLQLSLKLLATS